MSHIKQEKSTSSGQDSQDKKKVTGLVKMEEGEGGEQQQLLDGGEEEEGEEGEEEEGGVWDEARLVEAMEKLQEMYRQVRELRGTIPRLIEPFTVVQPSPQIMHQKAAKSIAGANEDIRRFRQLMDDESSRKILEHAKESRARNPKGIKPFKISDYPDWYHG